MLPIIFALLIGWFLGLFGFDTLVINGMQELFGVHLTQTGYYFLWVMLAILGIITHMIRGGGSGVKVNYNKTTGK